MTDEVTKPPFPLLMSFTYLSTALQLLITVNSWVTGLYNHYECVRTLTAVERYKLLAWTDAGQVQKRHLTGEEGSGLLTQLTTQSHKSSSSR